LVLTTGTNGLPDWWQMLYFGQLGMNSNASYDGQSNTLLYDYQNGVYPNVINFTIQASNQYVNTANVPLQLTIQSGLPSYCAVMLDSTNFPAASWTPYTASNITANMGTVQGWHTVWVGLCGQAPGAQQTWNGIRLNLDLTAPILVVTNASSVIVPMMQLQGYANEELANLTFDLVNANGAISNQTGYMTGAIFDTNSFSYTNNAFKCFDLVLASGVNTVTLHAVDLSGNLTTSNLIFNLDYSSKPAPVIQLYWPQDGTQIGAGSFTWRGAVDDPTVALAAQITDTNGDTNAVAGVIERNGNFWVDNIPLYAGTNYLALTAIDINSNVTTTNITVVQSSVQIAIAPITDDLNQQTVTVSGTINTNNYTVWVNGVAASQSGTAPSISWTANNVPLNGAGCAVVQTRAIPDTPADNYGNGTANGGGGTNSNLSNPGNPLSPDCLDAEINQDKPPSLICDNYHQSWTQQGAQFDNPSNAPYYAWLYTQTIDWSAETGGSSQFTSLTSDSLDDGTLISQTDDLYQSQWDTNGNGTTQSELVFRGYVTNTTINAPVFYSGPTTFNGLRGQSLGVENFLTTDDYIQSGAQSASTHYTLHSGRRSLPAQQGFWALAANAQQIVDPWYPSVCEDWDWSYEYGDYLRGL
jgi:hypothetical protein